MKNQFFLFLFLTLVVLSCTRCKEECTDSTNPDCPNYVALPTPADPCAGSSEVSAEFTVHQAALLAGNYKDTLRLCESHVIAGNRKIYLHANEDNAHYKWVVGADTIYDRNYQFVVSQPFIGQYIEIKLIIQKQADTLCHPFDNGMDTLTRSFLVSSVCNSLPYGTWYGAWDSAPLDSFVIAFDRHDDPSLPGEDCEIIYMKGHHQSFADSTLVNIDGNTYDYLAFRSTYLPQYSPKGNARVSADGNEIIIDYRMLVSNDIFVNDGATARYVYRGYRIN
jgi:hypothetical protein